MTGPVFVVGCPRSGTSVTGWAIAQHPRFMTGAESHFLYYLFRSDPGVRSTYPSRLHEAHAVSCTGDSWLDRQEVGLGEFAEAVGAGLNALFKSRTEGKTWVDSSPEHVLVISALAIAFPEAKFIHVVRDARSVCKSMLSSGFAMPWATDLEAACNTWNLFVGAGVAAEAAMPDRVLRLRQEQLRAEPETATQQIFDFLGADRPTAAVDFLKANTINSSYDRNSLLGGNRDRAPSSAEAPPSNWRGEMKEAVAHACGPLLQRLGYL